MAVYSQNGWLANDRSVIASYTVPGTTLKVALRIGDVSVVLLEYLRRYHLEVESLYHTPQDLWAFAERLIRGSATDISNHASGTAVDARATGHPLGVAGTFTAAQLHALDRLLAWFEGVLRHGKDYSGRKDEMHAEINAGGAEVKRIADKIRAGVGSTTTGGFLMALSDGEQGELLALARNLNFQLCAGPDANRLGWPTWGGGTDEYLTPVDYWRRNNVEVRVLRTEHAQAVTALTATVNALAKQVGELTAQVRSLSTTGSGGVVTASPASDFEITLTGTAVPRKG